MKTWFKVFTCGVLFFAFLFMSVGYAALTDTLTISGTAGIDRVVCYTVTYMIGDTVHLVDYHTDPTINSTVQGAPGGYSDFKQWVNANGHAVTTIPGSNTNDYVLYATWLSKYTIHFIDAKGHLIYSEVFTEGASSISGEGKAILDKWLADENAVENAKHITVTWDPYDLSGATGDIVVRPQYNYEGYLKLVPVYEEPDDGVVDYYRVEAVNNLPSEIVVPGYVGNVPVKVIDRLTNVDGKWNDFGSNVATITVQEGVEQLEHNSLAWTPKLKTVKLPNSLQYIGKNTFSRNTLGDWKSIVIEFNGSMAEWKAVEKHSDWDNGLTSGTVVQCKDGYFKLEGWLGTSWKEYPN